MRTLLLLLSCYSSAFALMFLPDSIKESSRMIDPNPDTVITLLIINNSPDSISIDTIIADYDSVPTWFKAQYRSQALWFNTSFFNHIQIRPWDTIIVNRVDVTSFPGYTPIDCFTCDWGSVSIRNTVSFITSDSDTFKLLITGFAYVAYPHQFPSVKYIYSRPLNANKYTNLNWYLLNGKVYMGKRQELSHRGYIQRETR